MRDSASITRLSSELDEELDDELGIELELELMDELELIDELELLNELELIDELELIAELELDTEIELTKGLELRDELELDTALELDEECRLADDKLELSFDDAPALSVSVPGTPPQAASANDSRPAMTGLHFGKEKFSKIGFLNVMGAPYSKLRLVKF